MRQTRAARRRRRLQEASIGVLVFLTLGFVWHAVTIGAKGLVSDLAEPNRFYDSNHPFSTAALFLHMLVGGLATLLAPLQMLARLRNRWPGVHRVMGYITVALIGLTAVGGLIYIGWRGTVGGAWMSGAFATYGIITLASALQTVRYARRRDVERHSLWATRLLVLTLASWIYRVHYGLWTLLTDGYASTADFDGTFDLVNVWAFFVPYLIAVELWWRFFGRGSRSAA